MNNQKGGGHFGIHTHDGDSPLDWMMMIEDCVVPIEFHNLKKVLNKNKKTYALDSMYELQKLIVKNNIDMLYKCAVSEIKKSESKANSNEGYMMTIVGLCILVSKVSNSNNKLGSLPKSLPKNYPSYLKNLSAKLLLKLRDLLEINKLGWKNPKKRLKAIELEYKLFTGKNMPKKLEKINSKEKPKKLYTAKSAKSHKKK